MSQSVSIPVLFRGVSFGDKTARLGVQINRDAFSLEEADEVLCGKRLTGACVLGRPSTGGQMEFIPDRHDQLVASFDVKSIRWDVESFHTGLTFVIEGLDPSNILKFRKQEGTLVVQAVVALADLPDGETPHADPEPEEHEHDDDFTPEELPEQIVLKEGVKGHKRFGLSAGTFHKVLPESNGDPIVLSDSGARVTLPRGSWGPATGEQVGA